ncbi:MAG TPA: NEW3 domain-containing protein [Bacteroidota bacterium]|nr:NEW3 domain-containing protein [Bacteroidota bacterium]
MFPKIMLALLLTTIGAELHGQSGSMFNQRDDQYRLLGLKRAKEMFETARKDYERQQQLFAKGLISQAELDRGHSSYSDAEVNYQQSLLAVLFEQQYVTVAKAVKYQTKTGIKHVRLTIANASSGGEEFQKLLNIDDKLFRSLQPDVINDVYVSLQNNESTVIGQPYESKVEQLRHGEPRQLDFTLLQDLDVVTVNMIYGKGTQRSLKVYLEKDASENKVIVQSQQFSQEVELGQTASYDLTLELFGGVLTTFDLQAVNLPPQINRYFKDANSQARLSQLKFTESTNTRRASLQISLPDRPTETVAIDTPIQFYVLVIPNNLSSEIKDLQSRMWSVGEIEQLRVGFVKLELLPRGSGKLLVRAQQLFHTIRQDGTVDLSIEIVNEGSRRLDNVEIKADPPINWTKRVDPQVIPSLNVGEEQRIHLQFTPPQDASVGRYEIRIQTTSLSDNQPVQGEDKTITVEIQAEANIFGTALIILLIIGLVAGMVVFGIRLSRK